MRYSVVTTIALVGIIMMAMPGAAATIHVAPDGDDDATGAVNAPFATLERARDAAREAAREMTAPDAVTVVIHGGTWERSATFELTQEDGGPAVDRRVIYRAAEGETVRISGGRRLPEGAFVPVRDEAVRERLAPGARDHVMQADLRAAGVEETGRMPVRFHGPPAVAELFFNDERMTLARWPNEGWRTVEEVIEQGSVPRHGDTAGRPGSFRYSSDRPSRWDVGKGVWLNGYWCFDWYPEAIRVRSIEPGEKRITFEEPHHYGVGGRPNRRWYAMNILAELDAPGEYYIDREGGTLYVWPPDDPSGARVVLSMMTDPIISLEGASHLSLIGLTLETPREAALTVSGGEDVQILACEVRNTGGSGISVSGGMQHRVEACDIHHTGAGGLSISGGDRRTLTPSGHQVNNNHIHHFGRRQRTYASGIHVGGVGQRISHNLLHDAPHQAIGVSGNEHLIEYNEVHHVIMETDDCGALYMGRNPSHRGTIVRYNFWHHLGSPLGHGNNAVYFDDGDGGQTVFGNVFLRAGEPGRGMGSVFCHGGHDNLVANNIFVECRRAIAASPWNDDRWRRMVEGDLWQRRLLDEVDITRPPYTTRYPDLIGFMQPGDEPRMNVAEANVVAMCGDFIRGNYVTEDNFITDEDPGFVDASGGNFALREDSVVFQRIPDFEPIPFGMIGLVASPLRPEPPDRTWTYDAPEPPPSQAEAPTRTRQTGSKPA